MAVKILIQRKIRRGKEKEFGKAPREIRSQAIHAQGYISGETLLAIGDPSPHLVISTWNSLEDRNRWVNSAERKLYLNKRDAMLQVPTKVTPYQYESTSHRAEEILSALESTVRDEYQLSNDVMNTV